MARMPETLVVRRAPFDMEEPWATPVESAPVRFRRAVDGMTPRLATSVVATWDDRSLSLLYSATDDYVQATFVTDDEPLYSEDVVEAFLAPGGARYFEFEVSPRGVVFDATVDSPDGVRQTMRVDRAWNCEGRIVAIRTLFESDGSRSVDTLLRIPFASLGQPTPRPGALWRANFFRIDRHPDLGDEFSAWQPTLRTPPDFHVVAAFGTLRFE